MDIILASNSPRRQEILKMLKIPFTVMKADTEEKWDQQLSIKDNSLQIAKEKASIIAKQKKDAIVIAGDTVVVKDGQVFGKPQHKKEAYDMLQVLSNAKHQVYTSIVVQKNDYILSDVIISDIYFMPIPKKVLNNYLLGDEWKDKAGAYAIQGFLARYIERIDGDYYAVMGLPLAKLNFLLQKILNTLK